MFIPHLSFYAFLLLFSQFPNSNTDKQQSHYSDGSNINSGSIVVVFLQHKYLNCTWSLKQYLIIYFCKSCLQENYRIFSLLQPATFIWNRFNTALINGNNRKISWAWTARSVCQHVTCSWERILVKRVFPLLSRKVTETIQTPLRVPWYSRAWSGRGEALKAHPPLATM